MQIQSTFVLQQNLWNGVISSLPGQWSLPLLVNFFPRPQIANFHVHSPDRFWPHNEPVAKLTLFSGSLIQYELQHHKLCKNNGLWCCNKLPGSILDFDTGQ